VIKQIRFHRLRSLRKNINRDERQHGSKSAGGLAPQFRDSRDLFVAITSRVTKSPRSILASTCRSNGKCAIDNNNNKKPNFDFRMRGLRETISRHITTCDCATAAYQRSSALINIFSATNLYNEHRELIVCVKQAGATSPSSDHCRA